MTNNFELLVALDKVHVVSKSKDTSVTQKLKPGNVVALANDKIVAASKKAPAFVVLSDEDEPVTQASGRIALLFGVARFKTKVFASGTYNIGDPLTADGFVLKKASTGDAVVAYVEDVLDNGQTLVVRWVM